MYTLSLAYFNKLQQKLPATVKLSVSLAVVLRHVTVVSSLMIVLDAVTCRVEVMLALVKVPLVLTLMREAINGSRSKLRGRLLDAKKEAVRVMSGLRHSKENDPNTRQVKVTSSPGHVNLPCLLEVSSTLSAMRER